MSIIFLNITISPLFYIVKLIKKSIDWKKQIRIEARAALENS